MSYYVSDQHIGFNTVTITKAAVGKVSRNLLPCLHDVGSTVLILFKLFMSILLSEQQSLGYLCPEGLIHLFFLVGWPAAYHHPFPPSTIKSAAPCSPFNPDPLLLTLDLFLIYIHMKLHALQRVYALLISLVSCS